jgi:hypothetical protein
MGTDIHSGWVYNDTQLAQKTLQHYLYNETIKLISNTEHNIVINVHLKLFFSNPLRLFNANNVQYMNLLLTS